MIRYILVGLLAVLVGIQFIRPARNIANPGPNPHDITALHPTPPPVRAILERACYDCHSDNTRYPWYAEVQPIAWWLDHHVRDGKRHLNFSQFGSYPTKRALKKVGEITEEVREEKMPLPSYVLVHRDAKLTPGEVQQLNDWVASVQARVGPAR